jgi:hypothetical protein
MLDAGSSRVFNCNDRARELQKENAGDALFFKVPRMHGLVVLKEAIVNDRSQRGPDQPVVGTNLYFPYNCNDVYEGGRSVFFHDPHLMSVLNEQFGLEGSSMSKTDVDHDLKILRILDGLPSLDGFLMRDALEIEGVITNENFFEVPEKERLAIYEFIRQKFEPLVAAAFGTHASVADKVAFFIDKIWEARDRTALQPLVQAFRFPEENALAIFASWKGIIYYSFEYGRAKMKREAFGLWLRDKAVPRDPVPRDMMDHVNTLRKMTIAKLRHHWALAENISQEYETLYGKFVSSREGVGKFLEFLNRSKQIYWRMGDSLSKINHAIHCWDVVTAAFGERKLPADKLESLFQMLQMILAAEKGSEAAAA